MILRNGKFYEGEQIVPLEFGNREQIRLIAEQQLIHDQLNGSGMPVDIEVQIHYSAEVQFKCNCGQIVFKKEHDLDEFEAESKSLFIGEMASCFKCKTKYEFIENEDGDLCVKIKK